eukprot:15061229-Alexandrium_andersonii.AAC.1
MECGNKDEPGAQGRRAAIPGHGGGVGRRPLWGAGCRQPGSARVRIRALRTPEWSLAERREAEGTTQLCAR